MLLNANVKAGFGNSLVFQKSAVPTTINAKFDAYPRVA